MQCAENVKAKSNLINIRSTSTLFSLLQIKDPQCNFLLQCTSIVEHLNSGRSPPRPLHFWGKRAEERARSFFDQIASGFGHKWPPGSSSLLYLVIFLYIWASATCTVSTSRLFRSDIEDLLCPPSIFWVSVLPRHVGSHTVGHCQVQVSSDAGQMSDAKRCRPPLTTAGGMSIVSRGCARHVQPPPIVALVWWWWVVSSLFLGEIHPRCPIPAGGMSDCLGAGHPLSRPCLIIWCSRWADDDADSSW